MDPQRYLIRLRDRSTGALVDKTMHVQAMAWRGQLATVTFDHSPQTYTYRKENVEVATGTPTPLADGQLLVVAGSTWRRATSVTHFGEWSRVSYRTADGQVHHALRATAEVQVVTDVSTSGQPADVLAYWRRLAAALPADDPTRRAVETLTVIHPDSALACYLRGDPLEPLSRPISAIYPFASNISQREAVEMALRHRISVVEGPPGTGKTQAILNIVASVVATGDQTVAVASQTNSAVDNVRDKLAGRGVGFIAASLGNSQNRSSFLAAQALRNADLDAAMRAASPGRAVRPAQMKRLTAQLRQAQHWERDRARLRSQIDAYRLEQRHFVEHVRDGELPDLATLPLLRKSPDTILRYLADTSLDRGSPRLMTRIRRYVAYGRTGMVDPDDIRVVLRLQAAYYERHLDELTARLADVETRLAAVDLDEIAQRHAQSSMITFQQALRDRYAALPRRTYADRQWRDDRAFARDYPVILSTCHSLAQSLPEHGLVDLLVIDESSQVSLLVAAVAMACAKRVVVVGDTRQLPHIPGSPAEPLDAPHPAYDDAVHSLLSSLHALYGSRLPRTPLVEHYRCAPDIIGFCNRSFYNGELIVYTTRDTDASAMSVWATADGNHMRKAATGGTSNQREIDVIRQEVIPQLGLIGRQVGYISPYRLQADKLGRAIVAHEDPEEVLDVSVRSARPESGRSDTVHKFQGRECDVVVLSTVIDDSWRGRYARRFVDEPRLINVAVSRAVNHFVLVTHHRRHPGSRYLSDLIGYIDYHDPASVRESRVVSVFDLLYRDYSDHLESFARRVRRQSRYPSEDLAWTALQDVLADDAGRDGVGGLTAVRQYRLANLFTDLAGFDEEQRRFIRTTSSVDIVVYRSVSLRPVLAIEVDGWRFHENNPRQQVRDAVKDSIFAAAGVPLLRLPTTGSGEHDRIKAALDSALASMGPLRPASP